MRLYITLLAFLGSSLAFSPKGQFMPSKSRPPAALKAFGVETVSALVSLDIAPSQQSIIAAAVAALVGLVGFAATSGQSDSSFTSVPDTKTMKSTEVEEAVDVSIPYNAAAMLEYTKFMGAKYDDATFQKFQSIYETKVVAQVTAKKVARDCQMEAERLQAIIAKADAELAELKSK